MESICIIGLQFQSKTTTDRYFFSTFSTVTFSQGENAKTDSVNTLLIQNLIEISIIDGQQKTPSKVEQNYCL
jgi:hypothetical protein